MMSCSGELSKQMAREAAEAEQVAAQRRLQAQLQQGGGSEEDRPDCPASGLVQVLTLSCYMSLAHWTGLVLVPMLLWNWYFAFLLYIHFECHL